MIAIRERLSRLEGLVSGLSDRVTTLTVVLVLLMTILIAVTTYSVTRMDKIDEKISDIPGKVSDGNKSLITTLSAAITATKQQSPQVILVPAPTASRPVIPEKKP